MSHEPLRLHAGDTAAGQPAEVAAPPATTPAEAPPPDAMLLTVPELAALLRVERRTVERWQSAGKLPGQVKIGRVVRYRRADVLAWIAAGCPAPARPRRPR